MNTHLDHEGKISLCESARLILRAAHRLRSHHLDGDAYHILNTPGSGFVDMRCLVYADHNADGMI
ncbi:hypothetical protein AYL99_11805 [Fonsecaea erecta]|uniref:Uncharacterized protein n=1 Tax=Fonsecaea erecta TaxID=1367422 RepID=A0A178Z4M9_9EURO|nr:hypothetical protein AYL99_11805 [Fonsecaea erecta]OAP54045.1 hypothetical protein AYL99_11805 [Fonsecaea erecta]